MWPCVIAVTWVGCFAAIDAAAHTLYKEVGQVAVLKPSSVPESEPIKSIIWKHKSDIAIELLEGTIEAYRQFKVRGKLNNLSGELTIERLAPEDSGAYTVEINDKHTSETLLQIISAVPEPIVNITCHEAKSCTLDCVGNTKGAEPVRYNWKLGDSLKENSTKVYHVKKEETSGMKKFSCELHNPVSKKSSALYDNPLNEPNDEGSPNGKIYTGVTVFASLLGTVLLLVFLHRCKSGMWFYEKNSMPWETEFWQKPRMDASVSNGAATHQQEYAEEETPMA